MKRVRVRKGSWEGVVSELGGNMEGVILWKLREESMLRRREWWSVIFSVVEELNYVRIENYFGILFDFDKSYFSWNGGDKRLIK